MELTETTTMSGDRPGDRRAEPGPGRGQDRTPVRVPDVVRLLEDAGLDVDSLTGRRAEVLDPGPTRPTL